VQKVRCTTVQWLNSCREKSPSLVDSFAFRVQASLARWSEREICANNALSDEVRDCTMLFFQRNSSAFRVQASLAAMTRGVGSGGSVLFMNDIVGFSFPRP
jgi:hypothetical protein